MKVRLLLTIALFTFAAGTSQAQVTIDVAKVQRICLLLTQSGHLAVIDRAR